MAGIRRERAQADLRLVHQQQLFVLERAAQVRLHAQAAAGLLVHLGGEACGGVLAAVLGVVHRRIGIAGERLHVAGIVRIQAHAHAGRDVNLVQVQRERCRQRGQDAVGERVGLLDGLVGAGRRTPRQLGDHSELVAADAAQHGARVGLLDHFVEPARHLAQQPVAIAVAERVVDDLEVVQVEQQQPDRAGLAGTPERILQPFVEGVPVGQLGHGIDVGQVVEMRLGLQHRPPHAGDHQVGQPHGAEADRHRQCGVAQQLQIKIVEARADDHIADRAPLGKDRLHHLQPRGGGRILVMQQGGIGRPHRRRAAALVQPERQALCGEHAGRVQRRRTGQRAEGLFGGAPVVEQQCRHAVGTDDARLHMDIAHQRRAQRHELERDQQHAGNGQRGSRGRHIGPQDGTTEMGPPRLESYHHCTLLANRRSWELSCSPAWRAAAASISNTTRLSCRDSAIIGPDAPVLPPSTTVSTGAAGSGRAA